MNTKPTELDRVIQESLISHQIRKINSQRDLKMEEIKEGKPVNCISIAHENKLTAFNQNNQ